MARSPFTKLRKILQVEIQRNYDNQAIVGGLAQAVTFWTPGAEKAGLPTDVVDEVVGWLTGYDAVPKGERPAVVAAFHDRMDALDADLAAQAPPPAATPKPEPIKAEVVPTEAPAVRPPRREKPAPTPEKTRTASAAKAEVVPRPELPPAPAGLALESPVTVISGIGPRAAETLAAIGLTTIRDMVNYFPRDYVDYSKLKPMNRLRKGETVTIIGSVKKTNVRSVRGGKAKLVTVVLSDGVGSIQLSFFNQPWLASTFKADTQWQVSGKIDTYLGYLQMNSPEFEALDKDALNTGRIVPNYRLTKGLTANRMRGWMYQAVSYGVSRLDDMLPDAVLKRTGLMPLGEAVLQLHFPDSDEALQAARNRLAFDELLLLQFGMRQVRAEWQSLPGQPVVVDEDWFGAAANSLPFMLTGAQSRVLNQVREDIARDVPMNRLVQGDVGSGKTVVAALAMAAAVQCGYQAALMAPTAILAEQHHQSLMGVLAGIPDLALDSEREVALLQGSTTPAEKTAIYDGLADGSIKVVVGTHALIQEGVSFDNLALAVVDEQHRFGVLQRQALRSKGTHPHLMVMTATPIPRTLALTLYGDLDYTVIDEMPPGRIPIATRVVFPRERERMYGFIGTQLDEGRQVYVVCPLVEESEDNPARGAVEEHQRLSRTIFKDVPIALLHGRMRPGEKDAVMAAFRDGESRILVSTTVVEVGVDVPNATVMLIEGANRFGLAQLHQLRGRVGRGEHKSYCLLMTETDDRGDLTDDATARLKVMEATSDGFELAQQDLDIRGPGHLLGTRQAGDLLKMASLTDLEMLRLANREAETLYKEDADLSATDHALLSVRLQQFWQSTEATGEQS